MTTHPSPAEPARRAGRPSAAAHRLISRESIAPFLVAAALIASGSRPAEASLLARNARQATDRFASLSPVSTPGSRHGTVMIAALGNAADPARKNPGSRSTESPRPADRDALLDLARSGRPDSARAAVLGALRKNPNDPFLLLLAGKLSPAGRESADYLEKALALGGRGPEGEEALFRLGLYTYAIGKYHLAIPRFRDYLRDFPDGAWRDPAMYWMGNACLAFARSREDKPDYLDSATAWFKDLRARTGQDDYYHPMALEGLAKARAYRGDRSGAWEAVQDALETAPPEEKPAVMLLAAQIRQGLDRNEEKDLLARLMREYPHSPEARYLGRLNAGTEPARWKSGPGLPLPAGQPATGTETIARERPRRPAADSSRHPPKAGDAPNADFPYTLQCGAFALPANADAMKASLAGLGLAPEISVRVIGGKRIYQVRIGRFPTADAAGAFAAEKLKPNGIAARPALADAAGADAEANAGGSD